MAFQGPYVETVLMGTRGHIPQVSEREGRQVSFTGLCLYIQTSFTGLFLYTWVSFTGLFLHIQVSFTGLFLYIQVSGIRERQTRRPLLQVFLFVFLYVYRSLMYFVCIQVSFDTIVVFYGPSWPRSSGLTENEQVGLFYRSLLIYIGLF